MESHWIGYFKFIQIFLLTHLHREGGGGRIKHFLFSGLVIMEPTEEGKIFENRVDISVFLCYSIYDVNDNKFWQAQKELKL